MCCSSQSYPVLNLGKLLAKSLLCASLFLTQFCLADSSSSNPWIKGPTRVSLGDYAQIDLPGTFKFAGPEAAGAFLKNSKPSDASGRLLGIAMPVYSELSPSLPSGDWYITFEYFD